MEIKTAIEAINGYTPQAKVSVKAFMKEAAPAIREKIRSGATLKEMYELVQKQGVDCTFRSFKTYLYEK